MSEGPMNRFVGKVTAIVRLYKDGINSAAAAMSYIEIALAVLQDEEERERDSQTNSRAAAAYLRRAAMIAEG